MHQGQGGAAAVAPQKPLPGCQFYQHVVYVTFVDISKMTKGGAADNNKCVGCFHFLNWFTRVVSTALFPARGRCWQQFLVLFWNVP